MMYKKTQDISIGKHLVTIFNKHYNKIIKLKTNSYKNERCFLLYYDLILLTTSLDPKNLILSTKSPFQYYFNFQNDSIARYIPHSFLTKYKLHPLATIDDYKRSIKENEKYNTRTSMNQYQQVGKLVKQFVHKIHNFENIDSIDKLNFNVLKKEDIELIKNMNMKI